MIEGTQDAKAIINNIAQCALHATMKFIDEIQDRFGNGGDRCIYVVGLRNDVANSGKLAAFSPPEQYRGRLNCVYVGQSVNPVDRVSNAMSGYQAGKGIVRDYATCKIVKQVQNDKERIQESPLWDNGGTITDVPWDIVEEVESYFGLKLSLEGYHVWGPHHHNNKRFLGEPPYD